MGRLRRSLPVLCALLRPHIQRVWCRFGASQTNLLRREISFMRILALWVFLVATSAFGGNLIQTTPFPSKPVPSDGQDHPRPWVNPTGKTIYIVRSRLFLYGGGSYNVFGSLSGFVTRNSDGSILTYWTWPVSDDTIATGPQGNQVSDDFRPDYFQLNAGETLTLHVFSGGFGGLSSSVAGWIWYSLTP